MTDNTKYSLWVSDTKFEELVAEVYKSYIASIGAKVTLKGLESKTIDPFEFAIVSYAYKDNLGIWLRNEFNRQIQKTLTNALGAFHQKLLGSAPNWESLQSNKTEVDLLGNTDEGRIYAEIKNKHNTMNSSSAKTVFAKLKRTVDEFGASKAYLVQILPKKGTSYDTVWKYKPKDGIANSDERIRLISGDRFYALVTKESQSMQLLQHALPLAINTVLSNKDKYNFGTEKFGNLEAEFQKIIGASTLEFKDGCVPAYNYFLGKAYSGTSPESSELGSLVETDDEESSE